MLTVEPREPQQSLDPIDFRKELIRRFFNPQSYFFFCVSTHLQNVPSIARDLDEDDYLLIGQVLEELVHPEDLFGRLDQLTKLKRFQDFCDYLEEGVVQLRELEPSPETMKQTIEGIAHFMVDTLIDILHEPESRERLAEIVGKQSSVSSVERVDINDSVIENLYGRATQEENEPAEVLAEDDIASPFQPALHAVSQDTQLSDELPLQAKAPEADIKPPARFVAENDEIIAASNEAPNDFSFSLQDEIEPFHSEMPQEARSSPEPWQANDDESLPGESREPWAMHANASRQIEGLVKQVVEVFSDAKTDSSKTLKWPEMRKLLQSLRETAMIYGIEEVEHLAFIGWRLLDVRAQKNIALGPAWKQLYKRLADGMYSVTRDDQRSMPELQQLSATFNELIEHPERIEEINKRRPIMAPKPEQKVVVVSHAETQPRRFRLPGEDDSELISLINEVRHDRHEHPAASAPRTKDAPEATNDVEIASENFSIPAAAANVESKPAAPVHPLLKKFHDETDIYFEIAEEAIRNLHGNSKNRLALDSLELAAYSLMITARKLGAEACARFPEHVEELVKNSLLNGAALDENHLQTIHDGLEKLKHANQLEEIESAEMRHYNNQILKFIKARGNSRPDLESGRKAEDCSFPEKQPPDEAIDFLTSDDL